mmetsp:Transcript_33522/g.107069  ORF Transcript_33522/g.107069 Transcript_33522/m.107069 type:complete len:294 (+) Transcript_33522:394-1275(+)
MVVVVVVPREEVLLLLKKPAVLLVAELLLLDFFFLVGDVVVVDVGGVGVDAVVRAGTYDSAAFGLFADEELRDGVDGVVHGLALGEGLGGDVFVVAFDAALLAVAGGGRVDGGPAGGDEVLELGPCLLGVRRAAFGDEDGDGLVEVALVDGAFEFCADLDDAHRRQHLLPDLLPGEAEVAPKLPRREGVDAEGPHGLLELDHRRDQQPRRRLRREPRPDRLLRAGHHQRLHVPDLPPQLHQGVPRTTRRRVLERLVVDRDRRQLVVVRLAHVHHHRRRVPRLRAPARRATGSY